MTKEEIAKAAKKAGWEDCISTDELQCWKTYDRKARRIMTKWFNDNGFSRVKDDRYGLVKDGIRVTWREGCANAVIYF